MQTWRCQDLHDGARICMTGRRLRPCTPAHSPFNFSLCKPGRLLPMQTWRCQDLHDGQEASPLHPTLSSMQCCLCKPGDARICMTGRRLRPCTPRYLLCNAAYANLADCCLCKPGDARICMTGRRFRPDALTLGEYDKT